MTFDLSKETIKNKLEEVHQKAKANQADIAFIDNFYSICRTKNITAAADIKAEWIEVVGGLTSSIRRGRLGMLVDEVVWDITHPHRQNYVYSIENIKAAFLEVAKQSEVKSDEEIDALLEKYMLLLPEESQKKIEALKVDWNATKTKIKYDASPIVDAVASDKYGRVAEILTRFYKENVDAIRQLVETLALNPQEYREGLRNLFNVFISAHQDMHQVYSSELKVFFDRCLDTPPVRLPLDSGQIEFISAVIDVKKPLYGIDIKHNNNRIFESAGVIDLGDNNCLVYSCENNDAHRVAFDSLLSKAKPAEDWNALCQEMTAACNTSVTTFNASQLVALYLKIIDQLKNDLSAIKLADMTSQQISDVVSVLFFRYFESLQVELRIEQEVALKLEEPDRTIALKRFNDQQTLFGFIRSPLTRLAENIKAMPQESVQSPALLCELLCKQATLVVRQPLEGEQAFGNLFLVAPNEAYRNLFDIGATFTTEEIKSSGISDEQFSVSREQYIFPDDSFEVSSAPDSQSILKNFFAKNLFYFSQIRKEYALKADVKTCGVCAQALWDAYVIDSRCPKLIADNRDALRSMLKDENIQLLLTDVLSDEKKENADFVEKVKNANEQKSVDSESKVYVEALNAVAILWLHPKFLTEKFGEAKAAEFKNCYRVSNSVAENTTSLRRSLAWVLNNPEVLASAIAYYNVNTNKTDKTDKTAVASNTISKTPTEKAGDYIVSIEPSTRAEIMPDSNDRATLNQMLSGFKTEIERKEVTAWLSEKKDAAWIERVNQHRLLVEAKKMVAALALYPSLWKSMPSYEAFQDEYRSLKNDQERAEFLISKNISEELIESLNNAAMEKNKQNENSITLEKNIDAQGELLTTRAFTPLCINLVGVDHYHHLSRMFNNGGIDLDILVAPDGLKKILSGIKKEIESSDDLESSLFSITQKILLFLVNDIRRLHSNPAVFDSLTDQFITDAEGLPKNDPNPVVRRNALLAQIISASLGAFVVEYGKDLTVNGVLISKILPCIGNFFGSLSHDTLSQNDFYTALENDVKQFLDPYVAFAENKKENPDLLFPEVHPAIVSRLLLQENTTFSGFVFKAISDYQTVVEAPETFGDLLAFDEKVPKIELATIIRNIWIKFGVSEPQLIEVFQCNEELFKTVLTSGQNHMGVFSAEGLQGLQETLSAILPFSENIRKNNTLMKTMLPFIGSGLANLSVKESDSFSLDFLKGLREKRQFLISQFADELDHASFADNVSLLEACVEALPKKELAVSNSNMEEQVKNDILNISISPVFKKIITSIFDTTLEFHEKLILVGAITQGKYNKIVSSPLTSVASSAFGHRASYEILKNFRGIASNDDVNGVVEKFRASLKNSIARRRTPIISSILPWPVMRPNVSKSLVTDQFISWIDKCIKEKVLTSCNLTFSNPEEVRTCYVAIQEKCKRNRFGEDLLQKGFIEVLKKSCESSGIEWKDIVAPIKGASFSAHSSEALLDVVQRSKSFSASVHNPLNQSVVSHSASVSGQLTARDAMISEYNVSQEKNTSLSALLENYKTSQNKDGKNALASQIEVLMGSECRYKKNGENYRTTAADYLKITLEQFSVNMTSRFFSSSSIPRGMLKIVKMIDANENMADILLSLKEIAAQKVAECNTFSARVTRQDETLAAYTAINDFFLNPPAQKSGVLMEGLCKAILTAREEVLQKRHANFTDGQAKADAIAENMSYKF
ncbi:MAG: hypothetical protein V4496_05480 [Pseudomonadota bacterium]